MNIALISKNIQGISQLHGYSFYFYFPLFLFPLSFLKIIFAIEVLQLLCSLLYTNPIILHILTKVSALSLGFLLGILSHFYVTYFYLPSQNWGDKKKPKRKTTLLFYRSRAICSFLISKIDVMIWSW